MQALSDASRSSSENVFSPAHWVGLADARPLACFRILLGVTLLQDLAARASELSPFLTRDGLFPLGSHSAGLGWSLFHLTTSLLALQLLFAAGTLVTVAFTVGFYTRLATLLTWVFFVSLHRRAVPIYTGGDALVDLLLFFACFVDLGGRFSMDALRWGARSDVRALVFRMLQYLPGLMYLYTARQKLLESARGWLGGPILFEHLQLDGWVRPPGEWLAAHPSWCAFLAGGTIGVELILPLLVVVPVRIHAARALAIVCNLGLQLGILLTLKVGIFTYVMLSISVLWVLPEWLDALGGRFLRVAPVRVAPRWDLLRKVLAGAVSIVFVCVVLVPPAGRRLPAVVHRALTWSGLSLTAGMFTRAAPSKRWQASGRLANGSEVDPLAVVAPAAFVGGFVNSQWMQLPYHLDEYEGMGRYVCERYNAISSGPKLLAWSLTLGVRPPHLPGQPRAEERFETLWTGGCPLEQTSR